ncbi:MAG: V-type ATPase subunit [Clostridiales bacterium]|nr:V-type ATPase subunit [Clostridiales bacterium]
MTQEKYAYAVTTVRIKEKTLLSTEFLEQLLSLNSYNDVRKLLVEHGWLSPDPDDDDNHLHNRLIDNWSLLNEISPLPGLLDPLVFKNDFHNLKAAMKCRFAGTEPDRYFMYPCLYNTADIVKCINDKQCDDLPEVMREAAKQAYDVFMRTHDGQYSDIMLDSAALAAVRDAGQASESEFVRYATELLCVSSNVKTAIRAIRTGKDSHFLETALCPCDTINKDELVSAALAGEDAVISYLASTPYEGAARVLTESEGSLSSLEKWFDDMLIERIQPAKSIFFGPEPLAAFYIACENEIRNIRILLSGKRHRVDDSVIRERMRRLYV